MAFVNEMETKSGAGGNKQGVNSSGPTSWPNDGRKVDEIGVVVSGISGRLPESDDLAEFKEHLTNGDDMVTESDRRWPPGKLEEITLLF